MAKKDPKITFFNLIEKAPCKLNIKLFLKQFDDKTHKYKNVLINTKRLENFDSGILENCNSLILV